MAAGFVDVQALDAGGTPRNFKVWSTTGDLTGDLSASQSVLDGANEALGAKADAAAGTDGGTFSLIALIKRLVGKFPGSLGAKTGALSLSIVPATDGRFTGTTPALRTVTATIANTTSLSPAVDLGGGRLVGILMPAAWTAAGLSFQMSSLIGGTYQDLYDATGVEKTVPALVSKAYSMDPAFFLGVPFLKVRSGTAAAAVNQGADRNIVLLLQD